MWTTPRIFLILFLFFLEKKKLQEQLTKKILKRETELQTFSWKGFYLQKKAKIHVNYDIVIHYLEFDR